jgi:hypothetical protein
MLLHLVAALSHAGATLALAAVVLPVALMFGMRLSWPKFCGLLCAVSVASAGLIVAAVRI